MKSSKSAVSMGVMGALAPLAFTFEDHEIFESSSIEDLTKNSKLQKVSNLNKFKSRSAVSLGALGALKPMGVSFEGDEIFENSSLTKDSNLQNRFKSLSSLPKVWNMY